MATQSPSEEDKSVPQTVVQNAIIEQAQAVAAAADQRSTRQEAPLQKNDLDLDLAGDTFPPPAYGDIYSEIHNEENGLGTSARVTDDGRFNIRINQVNRRLSQIFTPALNQQTQSAQDSRPPPSPYIPPSLGGEGGVFPPPALNIVIQVVGSRGDVQPFIALGKVLKDSYRHRVRLATHPSFKGFVQENGLEFFSIGGDPSRLMAFMAKNPSLMPGFRSVLGGDVGKRRKDVAEYIQGCWRSCYEAGDGMHLRAPDDDDLSERSSENNPTTRPFVADCIIANPPSFAHIHCAEKLGIPLHIMFTMPYSPTQAFPHPLANIQSSNVDPQLTNYISYAMIEILSWQGLGDIINRFRSKCLGLEPISLIWAPGMLHRLKVPHTYCWSPALIPKPKDWEPHITVSGFCFLDLASSYTPAPDLREFLDAGPPPVYIGFGSIVLDDPKAMTELIFEAVRKTGQRVLLSKGWGGIGADGLGIPDGVFMLGNVPHDWLFTHVSCVVHHGGAGTTAAGITAGRPTVIVPFFGDQPFWGAMVARAGAGPDPIPYNQLTADRLADAINFCLKTETLERAKELSSKIAAERGSDMGAQSFHQYLEPDRLRCTLAPSRPATWRIKRTQIRLSAFAACTLANTKLLDFHDLKLFRPQEYYTDEGPWDPVSGGAMVFLRAVSSMTKGVAEFPLETLKPLHISIRSSRKQSQESVPAAMRESEVHVGERSTLPASPEDSQTSLNVQESLDRARSLSGVSSHTSNTISNSLHGQLNSRKSSTSRNESSFSKDHDMMRQTGMHTSKGLGRIAKTIVKAPMDFSVSFTKGFHNIPKLWGDETVRPHEQVYDFKSGVKAVGKEFGYGWYDGVTGIFTQPWKGAEKEGPSGFFKGIGKGLGGFVAKPGAAMLGILGHTMKGAHKEVQKAFGRNVQNYIVASRVSQGYEEWLQSSDTEKQDVIARWKLLQKYLKQKPGQGEMLQDMLEAQRKRTRQSDGHTPSSAQSLVDPQSVEESLYVYEMNQTVRLSVSRRNAEEDASTDEVSECHRQQEVANYQTEQESLCEALAASETEAQPRVMAQRQSSSGSSKWGSERSLDEDDGQ